MSLDTGRKNIWLEDSTINSVLAQWNQMDKKQLIDVLKEYYKAWHELKHTNNPKPQQSNIKLISQVIQISFKGQGNPQLNRQMQNQEPSIDFPEISELQKRQTTKLRKGLEDLTTKSERYIQTLLKNNISERQSYLSEIILENQNLLWYQWDLNDHNSVVKIQSMYFTLQSEQNNLQKLLQEYQDIFQNANRTCFEPSTSIISGLQWLANDNVNQTAQIEETRRNLKETITRNSQEIKKSLQENEQVIRQLCNSQQLMAADIIKLLKQPQGQSQHMGQAIIIKLISRYQGYIQRIPNILETNTTKVDQQLSQIQNHFVDQLIDTEKLQKDYVRFAQFLCDQIRNEKSKQISVGIKSVPKNQVECYEEIKKSFFDLCFVALNNLCSYYQKVISTSNDEQFKKNIENQIMEQSKILYQKGVMEETIKSLIQQNLNIANNLNQEKEIIMINYQILEKLKSHLKIILTSANSFYPQR